MFLFCTYFSATPTPHSSNKNRCKQKGCQKEAIHNIKLLKRDMKIVLTTKTDSCRKCAVEKKHVEAADLYCIFVLEHNFSYSKFAMGNFISRYLTFYFTLCSNFLKKRKHSRVTRFTRIIIWHTREMICTVFYKNF